MTIKNLYSFSGDFKVKKNNKVKTVGSKK